MSNTVSNDNTEEDHAIGYRESLARKNRKSRKPRSLKGERFKEAINPNPAASRRALRETAGICLLPRPPAQLGAGWVRADRVGDSERMSLGDGPVPKFLERSTCLHAGIDFAESAP
jgi:hypothetical protein